MRIFSLIFSKLFKNEEKLAPEQAQPRKVLVSKLKRGDKIDGFEVLSIEFNRKHAKLGMTFVKIHFKNGDYEEYYPNTYVSVDK